MKRRYYLIGFAVFIGLLIGYHFLAASEAEEQIDKAIQEQSERNDGISVQYSSIEVSPFTAAVTIRDLTVILGDHIERAQRLQLNMSYLDFINIYFGGLDYGLEHLDRAELALLGPSYVNRSGLQEIKADSLHITYRGKALDGLHSAINGTVFGNSHSLEARSAELTISLPETPLKKLVAQQFRYSGTVEAQGKSFWRNGTHQFGMDSLVWTPSDSFQQSYSFFIKGFGYPTNAIPFQSAQLHFNPSSQNSMIRVESTLKSELALVSGSGFIKPAIPFGSSELHKSRVSLTQLSESLTNVLDNAERLFSVSLPRNGNGISIRIGGTLSSPTVVQ